MPHNIRVAVIGEDEYVPRLVRAILDRQIIPAGNMFLSEQDKAAVEAAAGRGVQLCESSAAAVVNSEIVLVCASRREMGTELAPISQCTRGRTLVTICDSGAVDIAFVKERGLWDGDHRRYHPPRRGRRPVCDLCDRRRSAAVPAPALPRYGGRALPLKRVLKIPNREYVVS